MKKSIHDPRDNQRLFTLDVFLIGGPTSKEFARRNRVVCRTIAIRGDQTLAQLHQAIFKAFGRWEEHFHEFQIGGKGPHDPKAKRYVIRSDSVRVLPGERPPAGDVQRATLDMLGLKVGQAFGYWFDFGDDWWHQINVVEIGEPAPRARYPKVVRRVGDNPPQYPEEDDEDEE